MYYHVSNFPQIFSSMGYIVLTIHLDHWFTLNVKLGFNFVSNYLITYVNLTHMQITVTCPRDYNSSLFHPCFPPSILGHSVHQVIITRLIYARHSLIDTIQALAIKKIMRQSRSVVANLWYSLCPHMSQVSPAAEH